jgi:hypothetical protein
MEGGFVLSHIEPDMTATLADEGQNITERGRWRLGALAPKADHESAQSG